MKLFEVIKLRGNLNPNTKPFMEEFIRLTTKSPIGKGRLYGDVLLDVSEFGGEIHVGDISAIGKKSEGSGTKALKFMIDLADKHNVRLSGEAKAYSKHSDHIQSSERLVQWYQKHGFVANGNKVTYSPKRYH